MYQDCLNCFVLTHEINILCGFTKTYFMIVRNFKACSQFYSTFLNVITNALDFKLLYFFFWPFSIKHTPYIFTWTNYMVNLRQTVDWKCTILAEGNGFRSQYGVLSKNIYFHKTLHLRCLIGLWIRHWVLKWK